MVSHFTASPTSHIRSYGVPGPLQTVDKIRHFTRDHSPEVDRIHAITLTAETLTIRRLSGSLRHMPLDQIAIEPHCNRHRTQRLGTRDPYGLLFFKTRSLGDRTLTRTHTNVFELAKKFRFCMPVIAAFGKQTERRGCTRPLCLRLPAALWPHCRCPPSALQRMLQKPVTA